MNYATPYELKDDKGNLFINKKKNKEGSPDWSGKIKLNGQEFYLSAWEKKTKAGDTFYSVSLGKMVAAQPTNGFAPVNKHNDMDQEIPF